MTTTKSAARPARPNKLTKNSKPHRLILRTYQVGFGDCFLLTFQYKVKGGNVEERHVLMDFGSTAKPVGAPKDLMKLVAEDIRKKCQGRLHAIVATHRHKDHISGFATNEAGNATGDIIASCNPDVVIQPWTEDPDAKRDATRATTVGGNAKKAFLASLDNMHSISTSITAEVKHLKFGLGAGQVETLKFLATDNEGDKEPANKSAIDNLNKMARGRKGNFYVSFDSRSGLEDILPGVKTHVLGPPTLDQSKDILNEAFENSEFWMLQAKAGITVSGKDSPLFPDFQSASSHQRTPPHTRWFIRRLHLARVNQLLGLVRILDDAMNNTSIILLFEVGGKKLLFPGDAQIENWDYALNKAPEKKREQIKALLEDVSLYKVGHHGSRNATPHTLWDMFARRCDKQPKGDLQTVVSTRADKHGDEGARTEVPRQSLVTALKKGSKYYSTQELEGGEICKVFEINF